jgi:hypothetical protein
LTIPPEKVVANYQKLLKTFNGNGLLDKQFSLSLLSDLVSYLLAYHQPVLAYIAVKLAEGQIAKGSNDLKSQVPRFYEDRSEAGVVWVMKDHQNDYPDS